MNIDFKRFNLIIYLNKNLLNIYKLNKFLIFIFIIFFFILLLTLFISFLFHRKFLKNKIYIIFEYYLIELFLIIIPLILVCFVCLFSTKILFKLNDNKNSNITIKIISYQWKWYFNYLNGLGQNINFFSSIYTNFFQIFNLNIKKKYYLQEVDNNLIIPIKRKIRLIFTSNDVIHSLYIPNLYLKQDAIPGIFRDIYFKSEKLGKYRGFCTELCGSNHSYMPIVINVLSLNNYKEWIISKYFINFLKFKF